MTKVLYLDIENAPNLGYVWGRYEQTVIKYEHESYMLAVSWRWSDDKRTSVLALPDFPDTWAADKFDDSELVAHTLDLLDKADIVIGHNVERFDIRKINAYAIRNDLAPPSPYRTIDTLKAARRAFAFNDNRLGALCALLDLDLKADPGGFDTWLGCMNGDAKAWRHMKKYAKVDVDILPPLYERLRPWIKNHPTLLHVHGLACARCGGVDLMKRGFHYTKACKYQTWQCKACRGYSRTRFSDPAAKPSLVSV